MRYTLEVKLGRRSYPVLVGSGLLARPDSFADALGRKSLVVCSETVSRLHLETLRKALDAHEHGVLTLPDGEAVKTLAYVEQVCGAASDAGVGRDGSIVAFGGGAIGDVAGFSAATYQRGIACIQVPTTLLAQVDSSIGGKTAVNHPQAKNLIGAFHQPRRVVADVSVLRTLPARELSCGLAEVIKYGLISDAGFLTWIEDHIDALRGADETALAETVLRCCKLKAAVVAADETEQGSRALLNLGHSFGHALETAGRGELQHGEAVAIGCVLAARLSSSLGWIAAADVTRIERLFESAGLPVSPPPGIGAGVLLDLMRRDKKVAAGQLRLVLLRAIGDAVVTADYPHAALVLTLREAVGA